MIKRVLSVVVALVYFIAGFIMMERADYPWATVQFVLAYLAWLSAAMG